MILNLEKVDITKMSEVENQSTTTTHSLGNGYSNPEC